MNEIILRPYQKEAIDKILWAKEKNLDGNDLVVLPTGAGKSIVIAEVVHKLNEPILIIQPSKEILEQNYRKLSQYVPASEIGVYSASMNEKTVGRYTFATIQSIYQKAELFKRFKLVIVDECFVAGTIVSGEYIEDIKVGDFVNSFNHKTNSVEKKKVLAVSKRWHKEDLTNIDDGLIISTLNHPIYIYGKGYIEASKVKKQDKVFFCEGDMQGMQQKYNSRNDNQFIRPLESKKMFFSKDRICILFKCLFGKIQGKKFVSKNDKKQSDEKFKIEKKNVTNSQENWTQTEEPRWKWPRNDASTKNAFRKLRMWVVSRVDCDYRRWLPSLSLQNRYRKSNKENCDRSGRWFSHIFNSKETRPEKRYFVEIKRLESVQIHKQANTGELTNGCWVYNLEVEDNNNYFANGVLVHNCHLVNPNNLTGMFTSFLQDMGNPKCVGLTATPYRMATGYNNLGQNWDGSTNYESYATIKLINRMRGKAPKIFWDRILYNINVSDLIEQGYLCGLEYIDLSAVTHEELPLNMAKTDFDMGGFERVIASRSDKITNAIEYAEKNCKSVLVFCSSVAQAERLSQSTKGSAVISSKTAKKEREKIIKGFKEGKIKTVFNMGVLTTGFDHPALDGIVLIRPTRSIALYYQMLGRGVRISQGKKSCKVIDLTSTVKNMGRVETIKLVKRQMWELESELADGSIASWHNSEVYRFTFTKPAFGSRIPEQLAPVKTQIKSGNSLIDAMNAVRNNNL